MNPKANFYEPFSEIFHIAVEDLEPLLSSPIQEVKRKKPTFDFEFRAPDVKRFRVLTVVDRLCGFMTNWAIDPAVKPSQDRVPKSRIEIHRQQMSVGSDNLRFRILTNFEDLETTDNRTIHGPNFDVEVRTMVMFGGKLPDHWETPTHAELAEGFTSVYEYLLPTGFMPKRKEI